MTLFVEKFTKYINMVIRNYFVLLNIIFPILFFGQNNDFFENEPLNLDFAISSTSETAPVNPFTDYKIQVDFSIGNRRLSVPGFYAADGNAAETSASSGGVWRVMFTPDQVGEWTYHVYFKKGKNLSKINTLEFLSKNIMIKKGL